MLIPSSPLPQMLGLCSALALSACAAPTPETPIPFEVDEMSEYLCLGADVPDSFCDANVQLLDAQVEFIASYLALPTPEQCIPALWAENTEICGLYNGCYTGEVVYSRWMSMPHELVHAVVGAAGLEAPLFIEEGLAEALSGIHLRSRGVEAEAIIEAGTGEGSLNSQEYESAGHFVAWMLARFGVESVVELYSRLDPDMGKDETISTIEALFDLPFSSLAQEYALAQGITYAGKGPFSCGASVGELSWDGKRTVGEIEFACDSGEDYRRRDLAHVLGHTEELWRGHRVTLPAGKYLFQLGKTGEYHYGILEMCLFEDTEEAFLPTPPQPVLPSWGSRRGGGFFKWLELPSALAAPGGIELELPAGTYILWIGWVEDPEPNIQILPTQSYAIESLD